MRATLLFAFVAAALALPLAIAQEPSVFRSGTELVEIDAVVHGKNGPVTGLTKDDFTLYDCNPSQRDSPTSLAPCKAKRQPIAVFREVDGAPPPAPPLPPGAVSNRTRDGGEAITSSTVVLLDQLNTPFDLKGYARLRVGEMLQSIGDKHRIALYSMGRNLQILQDFTDDPKKLMDAVAKLDSGDQLTFAQNSPGVQDEFGAMEAQMQGDMKEDLTSQALKVIIKHLEGVPGRKNLVWIAQGFGPPKAGRLLARTNIAVYHVMVRTPIDILAQLALRDVAKSRGEAVFFDAQDALEAVHTAEEDSKNYYVLGFYPAEADLDGKTHELTMEVSSKALSGKGVAKSDLSLNYRREYSAAKSGVASVQEKSLITDIFHSPLDASSIGLTAMMAPDPTRPGARRIVVTVDLADVQLQHEGDRWVGSLQVALRLEANEKNVRIVTPPAPRTVNIRLTDAELQAKRASGFVIAWPLAPDAKPGSAHVVIQDTANGAAGSVRVPIPSAK